MTGSGPSESDKNFGKGMTYEAGIAVRGVSCSGLAFFHIPCRATNLVACGIYLSGRRKFIAKGDSEMKSFLIWQRWLFVVGVVISIFGTAMALLSGTPFFDLLNRQIDPAFWGSSVVGDSAKGFQEWIYGVWGATIAGWGIFVTFIAHYPFGKKERWAWNCLAAGMLVWFVLDTSLSIYHRVYFNAVFNTALLILVGLPVAFTRRHFTS